MGEFTEMAPEDKCYIVFQGIPKAFYTHTDMGGYNALNSAEEEATRLAEETKEKHTILCVPKESLAFGLTAVFHGVVIHAMEDVEERED